MKQSRIEALRHSSRQLVRELGIIQLDKNLAGPTVQHCHALVEIGLQSGITVSQLATLLMLSVSAASRLVHVLEKHGWVELQTASDKREKSLSLTSSGQAELKNIDAYSISKVQGAFDFLTVEEQDEIISAIEKYSQALEKSRLLYSNTKVLTLSTSRPLRRQITSMVEEIQKNEFQLPVTDDINACIVKAEETFYYHNSCNFWYAVDDQGSVIGCIGLKKIDSANGELKKFFVAKRFRSKGLAQKLLAQLLKAASKHGFTKIWVGTVEKLAPAVRFYSKSGFVRIDEKELPKGFEKCHLDTSYFCGIVAKA